MRRVFPELPLSGSGTMSATESSPVVAGSEPVIVNIAAYRFVRLERLEEWRQVFRQKTAELDLRGTVLLSREGINLFVAGTREAIDRFVGWLRGFNEFAAIETKESPGEYQPFNRMLVRLKKEIISMGVPGIDPVERPSPKISPRTLQQWLDEGRPVTLLDTRNDYEVELGTFSGAMPLGISHFRQFPAAVRQLPEEMKQRPIVMFCTGGIRCEKAGPLMQQEGFGEVYQLEGGILKYFEECGARHYEGDCFVFDKRVAVNPQLEETDAEVCFACQAVLTAAQQQHPHYDPPHCCPHCFRGDQEQLQDRIARRQRRLDLALKTLPGSVACCNIRPLNVPGRFDQATALELFSSLHAHLGEEYWRSEFATGKIRSGGQLLGPDSVVRAGWRIEHELAWGVEPEVSREIRILHEDEWIVAVNKPAPLPMHPSGRFNRNTLVPMLQAAYPNERLRPAHRLDANTTGVVVLSRSRAAARMVQPQFEQGAVAKTYVARVHGVPGQEFFECDLAIGRAAGPSGGRSADAGGLPALTRFRRLAVLPDQQSLVICFPATGRTNQIRLHLSALGFPIVGDPVYGATANASDQPGADGLRGAPIAAGDSTAESLAPVGQPLPDSGSGLASGEVFGDGEPTGTLDCDAPPMCLHAWRLVFQHPGTGSRICLEAQRPEWAAALDSVQVPDVE